MRRHSFDPVSAALGIFAVVAGLFVMLGEAAEVDARGPWWIAGAAVLVGLAIIPWRRGPAKDVSSANAPTEDA